MTPARAAAQDAARRAAAPQAEVNMGWRNVLKVHPACELFPPLPPDELRELGNDIKKNRLQERAKVMRQGDNFVLVDGRSRLDAIEAVGLPIKVFERNTPNKKFFEVVEVDDPIAFVISANIRRRHLTPEQKRELIGNLLKADPTKSNRQIAELTKTSHPTVASERAKGEAAGDVEKVSTSTDTMGRKQPTRRSRPSAPPSDAPAPAPPAPGKFTAGQTLVDIGWALVVLVQAIADTTPAEVVAEHDPAALVKLARDAEVASAWLTALQVVAASAARRCNADQGAPPIASSEAVGTKATPAASVAPEASHRGGAL
jgi:hypothetical protein